MCMGAATITAATAESEGKVCRHVIFNEYREEERGNEDGIKLWYSGIGAIIIIVWVSERLKQSLPLIVAFSPTGQETELKIFGERLGGWIMIRGILVWYISRLLHPSWRLPFFRELIPSEPFVSQSLIVNFVRNFVHFGFGPSSEAQQNFLMN